MKHPGGVHYIEKRSEVIKPGYFLLIAILLSMCPRLVSAQPPPAVTPNIILIVTDDLDYADISIHGGTKTPTPNIDSIAKDGVQFTQAYATCPVCGPSRVALLSGRYQDRIGFVTNHGPKIPENFGLPSSVTLVPAMLKNAGYKTGMIGKWHLGFKPDMIPNAKGFDYFFGHLHGAHDYRPGVESPGPILRNSTPVKTSDWLTSTFGQESVAFIEANHKAPYFLYVPFNAVHSPLQASDALLAKFTHIKNPRDRTMAAMLYELDEAVGKILRAVEKTEDRNNTLVVFFNDNGGVREQLAESNGPLRGGKATLYEGGIRVPMFMRWIGRIPPGIRYENPVIAMDLVPTFLAAAGTTSPSELEGVDLLPYVLKHNEGRPHQSLFWRFVDVPDQKAVRRDNYKLVSPAPGKPWELYDLGSDPGETKDLAQNVPGKVSELLNAWKDWNKKNQKPLFLDSRIVKRRAELASRRSQPTTGTLNQVETIDDPAKD